MPQIKSPKANESRSLGTTDKRCCAKTAAKHHRWKRKWNCCSAVPDSPDVSDDIIRTLSDTVAAATSAHQSSVSVHQLSVAGFPGGDRTPTIANDQLRQPAARLNGMVRTASVDQKLCAPDLSLMSRMEHVPNQHEPHCPPRLTISYAKTVRPRLVRPWPIVRFRHMLRMIGRYRRADCRRTNNNTSTNASGNTAPGRMHTDHRDGHATVKQNQIRPISMDNDSNSANASNETLSSGIRLPVLPPPSRRKIQNQSDLHDELANTLSFVQQSSSRCVSASAATRRQRRKNAMRNRSPTLSPIHESGLSNPTSPQPFRHARLHPGGGYTITIPQTILDTP